ncbi:MAG: thioester reductase domain-containing protein [Cyanobacteria bacterium J06639_18]
MMTSDISQTLNTAEEIQDWMTSKLAEIIKVSPEEIDIQQSLEDYGLDSANAMVLVTQTEKKLGLKLSPTLLWHYPNIEALSQRLAEEIEISGKDNSQTVENNHTSPFANSKSVPNLAAEAVLDETIYPASKSFHFTANPENVFLTGGTGFLGAFLIYQLLQETDADIYCLVRAANLEEARNKLKNKLKQYAIWHEEYSPRVIPVLGDLSQPLLGISKEAFEMLAANMDAVYHSGAQLNYVYPYSALKAANVLGTQEVLRLGCLIKVKPVHYISSVAIFESPAYAGQVVKENDEFKHWEGIFLGYSQTKWVAEKLVQIAGERGLPVTIHRPPLISGDSRTGVCNPDDFINLALKGCIQMGVFPDIDYMLDASPVDYVSKAIVHLSRQKESLGQAFHLQHPQPVPFITLVDWLKSLGFPIAVIPYERWQNMLVENLSSPDNPLYTLRPFLLERWTEEGLTIPDLYLQANRPIVSTEATVDALAPGNVVCPPIDSQLFMAYSTYLIQNGFLELG